MRLALTTETFLPKIDGIVNTLCHLLGHLKQRGVESLLFAPDGGPNRYAATRVVGLPARALPFYPEQQLAAPWADLGPALEAFRPDLVHVLNPFALGVAGVRHARRLGIPLVASYHTDIPGYLQRWGYGFLQRPAWAYLRRLHNRAALNLCPSEQTRRQLDAHGIRRTALWTRGVDTDAFHPGHCSRAMRHRLSGGRPEAPLLLYVGRLAPEKQLDILHATLQTLPGARLALVGDGPARPRLERRFAGLPAAFVGYLHGPELAQAYASADLFVFPSTSETFGNVLLEAMASGLPAVAAAAGGPLEIVHHGRNGLLAAPGDPGAFAARVAAALNDPVARARLAEQARADAEGRSWDAVLDDLLAAYARAAGLKAPGPVALAT